MGRSSNKFGKNSAAELSRRRVLKGSGGARRRDGRIGRNRRSDDLGARNQGYRTPPRWRVLFGGQAIGDQAAKDLGFKVTMQNLDTSAAINRFITQPNTVDIPDLEGWQAKLAAKRGVIQGISVKKVKEFDNFLRSSPRANWTAKRFPGRVFRLTRQCTSRRRTRPTCTKA